MLNQKLKTAWLSNVCKDVLSGMTVAFALIPEAIAFSILAGVDPMVGLYASFCIAVTISIVGGRIGMISAATGAIASLMGPIMVKHGVEYLFAASILTGLIQYLMGVLKFGKFITFIPHSVVTGFVNALAIIIFLAQLPNFHGANWQMYAMVAGTLAIVYLFPLLTKTVPSALVAIIVMTTISMTLHLDLRTVGDMGQITQDLPFFHIPDIDFSLDTLWSILPISLALAIVGITESLMTATIVDEMTESKSDKNKEVRGQGIANIVSGFFGTMSHFVDLFDYKNDPQTIIIDFSSSHVWDHSAVTAINKTTLKYQQLNKKVTIIGLNQESKMLVEKVGLIAPSGH